MLSLTMVAACGDDDPIASLVSTDGSTTTSSDDNASSGDAVSMQMSDFGTFAITQTTAATGETAASPTSRSQSVLITFNSDGTATTSDASLVTISGQSVTATTADCNYVLTGNSGEGSSAAFNYKGTGDITVTLSDVTLHTTAKAIGSTKGGNVELVLDGTSTITSTAKKSIEVGDDTENSDGTFATYQKLDILGSGVLNVTTSAKGAISSTDAMTVNPGVVLNITVASGATGKKGLKSETSIDFKGGRTTVINNAPAEWDSDESDYSAATCVKAPAITVSGGTVQCMATGNGGKGLRADNTLTISGGTVEVITTGSNLVRYNGSDLVVSMSQLDSYSNYEDANPKGIHVGETDLGTGALTISGGTVKVKAVNSEGIESKMNLTVTGGTVEAYAGDDAINAGISTENNSGNTYAGKGRINISGGHVYAYSTSNDAIDANGTIYISGGTVMASGATGAECGIDCDNNTLSFTGGYIISMGGSNLSTPTESACTQSALITTASVAQGASITLQIGGSTIMTLTSPRAYSGGTFLISTPEMQKGRSCSLLVNGNTSSSTTLSSSQWVNGSSGNSGGPGGFGPGGNRP